MTRWQVGWRAVKRWAVGVWRALCARPCGRCAHAVPAAPGILAPFDRPAGYPDRFLVVGEGRECHRFGEDGARWRDAVAAMRASGRPFRAFDGAAPRDWWPR